MDELTCPVCGKHEYYTKTVPPHIGAYCLDCHTWIKWLPQNQPIKEMPYGKYRGIPIAGIPTDYLEWASKNMNPGKIRDTLAEELNKRQTSAKKDDDGNNP